ncbi:hypothetical protein PENANT_c007G08885 [Penicillium antarcticum]|uniref:DUF4604 domain-containing protein n=1 Tax=Penicillium antarcticum TaxID=416450 RepID=A0A1V6QBI3_9EURO|nr:uncharacterized protein N7508_003430 [Penicillium antarcticum]KAJ5312600.1 hypothetical protein N7508_003430 [Penicillium antarcticum]OQD86585.1 hypothetical protein PENANT_c007G08885 [Penicillium antarcticum]
MPPNPKFEYDAKEPAFLQKLRGQYGSNAGRLERPAVRATRLKVNKDDDDDEPTYVDEESNEVISKEDYKNLVRESGQTEESNDTPKDKPAGDTDKPGPSSKQSNLTEVGGQRKRKQVKVVGEESTASEDKKTETEEAQPKAPTKKAKKTKKIKLSFDEE